MPYPSKTNREAVLAEAVTHLERNGLRALSLRGLAGSLGLAPNALYRYFTDRAALEAALTGESTRRLNMALRDVVGDQEPASAIRDLALGYLRFAREHRHLYKTMMLPCPPSTEGPDPHDELWAFVCEQVASIAAPQQVPEAAVALWAFLHGMIELEAVSAFGEQKPSTAFDFGLAAWLTAAAGSQGTDSA